MVISLKPNTARVGAIIQCRMSSSRLPQKCLLRFPNNQTVIEKVIANTCMVRGLDEVIVAMPEEDRGSELHRIVAAIGVKIFLGSQHDVLNRFIECAKEFTLDYVLRVTADDPFRLPEIEESVLRLLIGSGLSYVSTKGLPLGQNAEAYRAKCLSELDPIVKGQAREHVTTIFKQSYKSAAIKYFGFEQKRLTLDSPEDWPIILEEWRHQHENVW